jgi:hypothetical protein
MRLDAYDDGGCPIQNHVISYKRKDSSTWLSASENVVSEIKRYKLENLQPATTYELRISSTNPAGTSELEAEFTTLTEDGGVVPPQAANQEPASSSSVRGGAGAGAPIYSRPEVMAPIVVLTALGLVSIGTALYCRKKSKYCSSTLNQTLFDLPLALSSFLSCQLSSLSCIATTSKYQQQLKIAEFCAL